MMNVMSTYYRPIVGQVYTVRPCHYICQAVDLGRKLHTSETK